MYQQQTTFENILAIGDIAHKLKPVVPQRLPCVSRSLDRLYFSFLKRFFFEILKTNQCHISIDKLANTW